MRPRKLVIEHVMDFGAAQEIADMLVRQLPGLIATADEATIEVLGAQGCSWVAFWWDNLKGEFPEATHRWVPMTPAEEHDLALLWTRMRIR